MKTQCSQLASKEFSEETTIDNNSIRLTLLLVKHWHYHIHVLLLLISRKMERFLVFLIIKLNKMKEKTYVLRKGNQQQKKQIVEELHEWTGIEMPEKNYDVSYRYDDYWPPVAPSSALLSNVVPPIEALLGEGEFQAIAVGIAVNCDQIMSDNSSFLPRSAACQRSLPSIPLQLFAIHFFSFHSF